MQVVVLSYDPVELSKVPLDGDSDLEADDDDDGDEDNGDEHKSDEEAATGDGDVSDHGNAAGEEDKAAAVAEESAQVWRSPFVVTLIAYDLPSCSSFNCASAYSPQAPSVAGQKRRRLQSKGKSTSPESGSDEADSGDEFTGVGAASSGGSKKRQLDIQQEMRRANRCLRPALRIS